MPTRPFERLAVPIMIIWFALAALCGCAGPTQKSVSDWHDAVVAVRDQSGTTFRGVNDLVRGAEIRRAPTLSQLRESDFQPGLDAQSIAAWNSALDSLIAYSAALSSLLNPELATGLGDSTKSLGEAIATSSHSAVLDKQPGLASAVGKLGAKLVSLTAGQNAKTIMAQTNGAVNDVLDHMARMINDESGGQVSGIYPTVHTNGTKKADDVRGEFLKAKTPEEKRDVATRYVAALEERDAADAALLSLRASILELAAAHSRAAAGGPMDTSALIANIREQTAFFKEVLTDLKPAKN
jgi:hypothetical protein